MKDKTKGKIKYYISILIISIVLTNLFYFFFGLLIGWIWIFLIIISLDWFIVNVYNPVKKDMIK